MDTAGIMDTVGYSCSGQENKVCMLTFFIFLGFCDLGFELISLID